MLLKQLRDYSERLTDLPPAMYLSTPIRWILDLDADGKRVAFISTPSGERKNDRGLARLAPHIGRTVAVQAKLLADNAEYVLGLARDPAKQARVDRCHAAFVALVRDCAERTGEPSVRAVLRFLESLNPSNLLLPAGFEPAHVLTFRVEGTYPIDVPAVRDYWAAVAGGGESRDEVGERMECLVCGRERPPVNNIPIKIKRIPGGQPSGMALVSTNAVSFESYGLEAMSCAPICQECGERFSKAANALIVAEDTHLRIGPLVYLFWTREETGFRPGKMIARPQAEQVKALLDAARRADASSLERDANQFYATAFSASGARVVVRDWLQTTVPTAQRYLARYFALQQLVQPDGGEGQPIGLYALAASTVRDAGKNLVANVPRALLRVALKGGTLPDWLLYQAVKRNRSEQKVTRPRAALIKMVLLSRLDVTLQPEEFRMVQHNPDDPFLQDDPRKRSAYLCGCLLAALERIQKAAVPGAKATITDRFYGTASSAPASVFGRLLRLGQSHLGKLRKEKPGVHAILQHQLEEIQKGLASFPRTLTLEQQGLFSLGYYHQRARDRAEALERKKAKEAKKQPGNSKSK
jgi:CRISPR-associated protein Csd1